MSGKDRRSCLKRADYCEDRLEEARAEHARSTRVENLGRNGCDDACCSTSVGHGEQLEISRTEFESFVRDGFYFEEDTLEELHLDEVVAGVNRELDLMKSFPVFQAVPRAEVTGKVWSTRWCYKRKGPKQVRARFVVRHFANNLDANFYTASRLFHEHFAAVLHHDLVSHDQKHSQLFSWILRATCSLQCTSMIRSS